jgi:hypothetical protein
MISLFQLRFLLLYTKRLLSVALLVILAPLMCAKYPFDKIKGGGTSLSTWAKEFGVNMLIQPIHALMYIIFIVSCQVFFEIAPLLYAVMFTSLARSEKTIKQLFDLRGVKSINSFRPLK